MGSGGTQQGRAPQPEQAPAPKWARLRSFMAFSSLRAQQEQPAAIWSPAAAPARGKAVTVKSVFAVERKGESLAGEAPASGSAEASAPSAVLPKEGGKAACDNAGAGAGAVDFLAGGLGSDQHEEGDQTGKENVGSADGRPAAVRIADRAKQAVPAAVQRVGQG